MIVKNRKTFLFAHDKWISPHFSFFICHSGRITVVWTNSLSFRLERNISVVFECLKRKTNSPMGFCSAQLAAAGKEGVGNIAIK